MVRPAPGRASDLVREAVRLAAEHYDSDAAAELVAAIEELYVAHLRGERLLAMRRLLQLYSLALTYLGRHEPGKMMTLTEKLLRLAEKAASGRQDEDWVKNARSLAGELEIYACRAIGC